MDPFTQRILEKAEQRSRTLGISNSTKVNLNEVERKKESAHTRKLPIVERVDAVNALSSQSASKITRHYSVDKENVDVGIEINITTGSNVEVQVEVEEQDVKGSTSEEKSDNSATPAAVIRDTSRNRLQRLGALYSNTDISSPIHRTEGNFHAEDSTSSTSSKRAPQKLGKLAALADCIKNWEDDTSHPDYKHSKLDVNDSISSSQQNIEVEVHERNEPPAEICHKYEVEFRREQFPKAKKSENKLRWDKTVLDSLEAQGFQRRQSENASLSYEYKDCAKSKEKTIKESQPAEKAQICAKAASRDESKFSAIKTGLVSGRAAAFENKASASPTRPQKDPAEMSLKERMMLFERNKGKALVPKAAFAMSAPVNKISEDVNRSEQNVKKNKCDAIKDFPIAEVNVRNKVAALTAGSSTISEENIKANILKQRQEDLEVLANRFNKQKDVQKSPVKTGKENIISAPPPPPPPMPPTHIENKKYSDIRLSGNNKRRSPGVGYKNIELSESGEDNKRIRTSAQHRDGRLYPNLSDLETDIDDNYTTATVSGSSSGEKHKNEEDFDDSYMESEDSDSTGIGNVSLGREIMRVVQANESHNNIVGTKTVRYADTNNENYYGDSSINSCVTSDVSVGIDDYLDEALEEDEESEMEHGPSNISRHSQGTTSSNSFSYLKRPRKYSGSQTISEETDDYDVQPMNLKTPLKSSLTIDPANDQGVVTLVHTVSFYRRQQASNSNNSTPVRMVHRDDRQIPMDRRLETEEESSDEGPDEEEHVLVQEKIKKLLDEVCKQQQVIAQTSQALNLCASTIEFSGSTESVEGERHLLVATHRRQAALDEIQRLRVEGRLIPHNGSSEKGRLTVKEITVPLKSDYIRKVSNDAISGHHLVCLLKYNENVLATKTVPTLPGLQAVKFPDILQLDVHEDFRAILEIYGMTAQREILPHEVKYHINLNKKGGIKTPKKKGSDSRLIMPIVQSPAGPHVVRTPALVQYGFSIFSLREVQRTTWTLTEASRVGPLEGTVHMKINCELTISVEYKGFLTMFEEISGFGAWHRRWCHLTGHVINYWKYPDDEKKKAPMGSIDLNTCCTPKVTTAPRDLCARLHTLLLECLRPGRDSDVRSHLIIPRGNVTIVRYLLSADTREERDEWAAHINKTVSFLRAWGKAKQRE